MGKYEFQHMHSRTHVVEHCCTSKSAKPLYTGLGRAVYCCKKEKKKKSTLFPFNATCNGADSEQASDPLSHV